MNKANRFLLRATTLRDDREGFRLFFHHYYTRLVRFALLFDSNRSDAENIVSEVTCDETSHISDGILNFFTETAWILRAEIEKIVIK